MYCGVVMVFVIVEHRYMLFVSSKVPCPNPKTLMLYCRNPAAMR